MTTHIIRLAVGVASVEHLQQIQKRRLADARRELGRRKARLRTFTRNRPRRAAGLLGGADGDAGGSLYWVVKGIIRVRQRVLGLEDAVNPEGRKCCALILDPELVLTVPRAKRAFQGWRYLPPEDAPADLGAAGAEIQSTDGGEPPPAEVLAELKELGLI